MQGQISTIVGLQKSHESRGGMKASRHSDLLTTEGAGKQSRSTIAIASNEMVESPRSYIMYVYEHGALDVSQKSSS